MRIFVGVNYGGGKGWKYCWSQWIGRARGEESHACRFFPHGVEWWDRRRENECESRRHIVSTHGGKDLETNGLPTGMGNGA